MSEKPRPASLISSATSAGSSVGEVTIAPVRDVNDADKKEVQQLLGERFIHGGTDQEKHHRDIIKAATAESWNSELRTRRPSQSGPLLVSTPVTLRADNFAHAAPSGGAGGTATLLNPSSPELSGIHLAVAKHEGAVVGAAVLSVVRRGRQTNRSQPGCSRDQTSDEASGWVVVRPCSLTAAHARATLCGLFSAGAPLRG